MAVRCVQLVLVLGFVPADAGLFLFPALPTPTDFKGAGQSMAEEMQKSLPVSAGLGKQLEPSADQPKEDEQQKETRGELLAGASMFNAASSSNTEEQQAVEDALREAIVSSPAQLGGVDRGIEPLLGHGCVPDFTNCPEGWVKEGALCVAGGGYTGRCAAEADLSDMSLEQKLAFSDFCAVKFPCQVACGGGQDFHNTCPSLWREVGKGVCQAPLEYEGSCSVRLNVGSMSEEEKYAWSVRCGARWPCAAPEAHNYQDVCPEGWSLQAGQVCQAPSSYSGPCEHTASLSGATEADKKTFEASCRVAWAGLGAKIGH